MSLTFLVALASYFLYSPILLAARKFFPRWHSDQWMAYDLVRISYLLLSSLSIVKFAIHEDWSYLGITINNICPSVLYGACAGICFILIQLYIFRFREIVFVKLSADRFSIMMLKPIIFTTVTPLAEEVFFRGFFQRSFQESVGITISVFVTSIAFMLSHGYWAKAFKELLFLTFSALVLSSIAGLTSNVIGPIIAHSMNNSPAAVPIIRYLIASKLHIEKGNETNT